MKENKAFAVADMSNFKSHNSNPWGLVYADAVRETGVEVEQHEYEGLPHGFGYTHEAWMVSCDRWMTEIMANN